MSEESATNNFILNAAKKAFKLLDLEYTTKEENNVIETSIQTDITKIHLHLQAFEDIHAVNLISENIVTYKPDRFDLIFELLMRANQTITFGSYESDPDQFIIYFKQSNIFPILEVTEIFSDKIRDIISSLVHSNICEMERITPIIKIINDTDYVELRKLKIAELWQNSI